MSSQEPISERARRLLRQRPIRIEEELLPLDPLTLILLLPFLPLYLLLISLTQPRKRVAVTEIEKTPAGWRIIEYERS